MVRQTHSFTVLAYPAQALGSQDKYRLCCLLQLKMWIFLILKAQDKLRLGEIISLRVLVTNKWTEPVDALISIPASDDYEFVEIDREDGSTSHSVSGEHQVMMPPELVVCLFINVVHSSCSSHVGIKCSAPTGI